MAHHSVNTEGGRWKTDATHTETMAWEREGEDRLGCRVRLSACLGFSSLPPLLLLPGRQAGSPCPFSLLPERACLNPECSLPSQPHPLPVLPLPLSDCSGIKAASLFRLALLGNEWRHITSREGGRVSYSWVGWWGLPVVVLHFLGREGKRHTGMFR